MYLYKCSFIIVLVILFFSGCTNQENAGALAKGKILFNGKPLVQSSVTFQPVEAGSSSHAVTDNQGNFELKTGVSMKGVRPGNYEVSVESWKYYPDQADEKGNVIVNGLSNIPRKYTNPKTSGFTATIKHDVQNEFTFELTGEGEKVSPKEEPQK